MADMQQPYVASQQLRKKMLLTCAGERVARGQQAEVLLSSWPEKGAPKDGLEINDTSTNKS